MKIKTYYCGMGDGMFEADNDEGAYVSKVDYDKLLKYKEDLFELANESLCGLSYDELHELAEKNNDF